MANYANEDTPFVEPSSNSHVTQRRDKRVSAVVLSASFVGVVVILMILASGHVNEHQRDGRMYIGPSWWPTHDSAKPVLETGGGGIDIEGLPELNWLVLGGVGVASVNDYGTALTMVAARRTARFNPPSPPTWSSSGYVPASALVFEAPAGDWQLSAKVTVPNFEDLFDSGCLFGYHGPDDWVNLCFEYSPEKVPEIVSVVTRGVSDDANGAVIEHGNSVYLRLSRFGDGVFASHWSLDGKYWTMNRHFVLRGDSLPIYIGFDAQAPTSDTNTAIFSVIAFSHTTLLELRNGS